MQKFIYSYLLLLAVLFGVLYWDISPVARYINHYQTQLVLYFLDMGLKDGQLQGIDIMINPHYKVIITQACNGMIPYLVLLSSVLAYPTTLKHKLFWAFIGYVMLFAVNIIRLFVVVYFVTKTPSNFSISHDIFGNFLLIISGLTLFYLFLRDSRTSV